MWKDLGKYGLGAAMAASLAMVSAPAYAEGLPPYAQARHIWTGLYTGLQIGFTWDNNSDIPWTGVSGGPFVNNDGPLTGNGGVAGAHLGFNFGCGGFVCGVEGDFEGNAFRGDDHDRGGHINGLDGRWMASLRARFGMPMTPLDLVYLTGGVAWMGADTVVRDQPLIQSAGSFAGGTTFTGWTLGAGWEHVVIPNKITVRFEYRYTEFGNEREPYTHQVNGFEYDLGFEPHVHALRMGLSVKLP